MFDKHLPRLKLKILNPLFFSVQLSVENVVGQLKKTKHFYNEHFNGKPSFNCLQVLSSLNTIGASQAH